VGIGLLGWKGEGLHSLPLD